MKFLSWVALIIGAAVAINEYGYIKTTSLAWVVIGLAVSIILLAIGQIACRCCKCKPE